MYLFNAHWIETLLHWSYVRNCWCVTEWFTFLLLMQLWFFCDFPESYMYCKSIIPGGLSQPHTNTWFSRVGSTTNLIYFCPCFWKHFQCRPTGWCWPHRRLGKTGKLHCRSWLLGCVMSMDLMLSDFTSFQQPPKRLKLQLGVTSYCKFLLLF